MKKKNYKKGLIGILVTGIAAASIVAFAGCGMFGGEKKEEEVVIETTTAIPDDITILEKLAKEEALVDTKAENDKITEYFTDGTFVEYVKSNDKVESDTSEGADSEKEENNAADDTTVQDAVDAGTPDVFGTPASSSPSENWAEPSGTPDRDDSQLTQVDAKEESKGSDSREPHEVGEFNASKVIVHTPKEKVIRDKEGMVKVSDVNINTESQNLIYKDNKIVVQEITEKKEEASDTATNEETTANNDTPAIVPAEEKIIDVAKLAQKDVEYIVTEYDKETYDNAFEKRETFVEHAKDTDERIAEVIEKEVKEVVEDIKKKEEIAKNEAQAQEIKETEVKKDDAGNTVITGKDDEGNKVEIITDKEGVTEVKKTDTQGNTTVIPTVAAKPTEATKETQPPQTQPTTKQTQPTTKPTEKPTTKPTEVAKTTQPAHTHNWQPVYKTVHHDAVTHQETYTEKQPYTYTEKEPYTYTEKVPYTYQEPYTYTSYVDDYEVYYCTKDNWNGYSYGKSYGIYTTESEASSTIWSLTEGYRFCYRTHQSPVQKTDYETKTGYKDVQKTGYKDVQKTGYKDVKKTRTVTDKAAWDEKVVDYYKCSCGQTKK